VDEGAGPIVALASMDDKLILFKGDRVFYILGDGPDDTGGNNDYTPPQRIASDCGCLDWRSVVSTHDGVYFMSAQGRKLLTRDLQVVPVTTVETLDQTYPVTTSAIVHPSTGELRWTQNTDDTSSPRSGAIVYRNYILECWSNALVNDGAGHSTLGFVSSVVAQSFGQGVNLLHLLDAAGNLYVENAPITGFSLYQDEPPAGAVFVPGTWSSPWLKADGLVGWASWKMLRLTLQTLDFANVTVNIYSNYNGSAPIQTASATSAQISAWTTALDQWEIQFNANAARAESIQIVITDASGVGTATGQGFKFAGVRVDYTLEQGAFRTPVAQRS
jgi:hypothetical protein